MTSYNLTEDENNVVKFWTDNEELRQEVCWFISLIADGISWRNRLERVMTVNADEEGSESK